MSLGLRHIQKRKKMRDNSFPNRLSIKKHALDVIMMPIAIVAPLALVPQVYALYTSKDATGHSLATWLILGFVSLMWVWYGRVHRERPIIVAQAMFVVLNFVIALGVFLYR